MEISLSHSQTLSIPSVEYNLNKLSPFRFGNFQGGKIITTDQGTWHWLEEDQFSSFLDGTLEEESDLYTDLCNKGFIRSHIDIEECAQSIRQRYAALNVGPELHQIILCDNQGALSIETAKSIVNFAMQSSCNKLHFELFQNNLKLRIFC